MLLWSLGVSAQQSNSNDLKLDSLSTQSAPTLPIQSPTQGLGPTGERLRVIEGGRIVRDVDAAIQQAAS